MNMSRSFCRRRRWVARTIRACRPILFLSVGGDGTFLRAASWVGRPRNSDFRHKHRPSRIFVGSHDRQRGANARRHTEWAISHGIALVDTSGCRSAWQSSQTVCPQRSGGAERRVGINAPHGHDCQRGCIEYLYWRRTDRCDANGQHRLQSFRRRPDIASGVSQFRDFADSGAFVDGASFGVARRRGNCGQNALDALADVSNLG